MRIFYSLLTGVVSLPLLGIFSLHPRGRIRLMERLGIWNLESEESIVWFHGASNGEVRGLIPVIERFRSIFPKKKLLLTATSPTALSLVEDLVDEVRLLPFDSELWLRGALKELDIEQVVISETEIWPALISFLGSRKIPIVIINGRISDYSWPKYKAARTFLKPLFHQVAKVLVSDSKSQERFRELGLEDSALLHTGNSKYDVKPSVTSKEEASTLREKFFEEDLPVLVLASLWPGEENAWFSVLKQLLSRDSSLQILIAPRHREKFEYFAKKLDEAGIPYSRRALSQRGSSQKVLLLDSLGELEQTYSFAQGAFIGGSLVDVGGHNPLEACAYGVRVAMGPNYSNVGELARDLIESSALTTVSTQDDLLRFVEYILTDSESGKHQGALEIWKRNCGATDRIVEVLQQNAQ